jgi:hypothetical protein
MRLSFRPRRTINHSQRKYFSYLVLPPSLFPLFSRGSPFRHIGNLKAREKYRIAIIITVTLCASSLSLSLSLCLSVCSSTKISAFYIPRDNIYGVQKM